MAIYNIEWTTIWEIKGKVAFEWSLDPMLCSTLCSCTLIGLIVEFLLLIFNHWQPDSHGNIGNNCHLIGIGNKSDLELNTIRNQQKDHMLHEIQVVITGIIDFK